MLSVVVSTSHYNGCLCKHFYKLLKLPVTEQLQKLGISWAQVQASVSDHGQDLTSSKH